MVDCFIFPAATEKKMQSMRLAAKTRALTSAEKWKLFREKIEQKGEEDEHKKKRIQEREKKRAEKIKSKKENYWENECHKRER